MKAKASLLYGILKAAWSLFKAIQAARKADSDEGKKITLDEALEIFKTVVYQTAGIKE
jgi:hypothetical protein